MAIKICGISFSDVDNMEMPLLLDLVRVYNKVNDDNGDKEVFIDDIL